MFVEVKEENKFEECSNHVDTSDRLDVILTNICNEEVNRHK
jgi:hypothetical protein